MPNRYWVGGTAAWDGTAGTKWATTSGGAGGASVPNFSDDVFFTNLSTGTCTISAGNTGAFSINCTGFTGTITGTADITVSGNVTLSASQTYTYTGRLTMTAGTLTTAGKTIGGGLTINAPSGQVLLGDALTLGTSVGGGAIEVTAGNFNTSSFSVTGNNISSSSASARNFTLNSSTITLNGNPAINISNVGAVTFTAGTSNINFTGGGGISTTNGITFNNVTYTSTAASSATIYGANTFSTLTLPAVAAGSISEFIFGANQTITTLICSGSGPTGRVFLSTADGSGVFAGTARTLTVGTWTTKTDVDFRDITAAGASAPWSGTRFGNCGGNTNITFPAAKTVYWNLAGTNNWDGTGWATTSGGTPASTNFPLAQDTCVFDDAGAVTSVNALSYNIGTINMSSRTSAMTFQGVTYNLYGSFTIGSGVTLGALGGLRCFGRGTQTLTTTGKVFAGSILVNAPGGTVVLADSLVTSANLSLTQGTLNLNNNTLTCATQASIGSSAPATLAAGTGTVVVTALTSQGFVVIATGINLTVTGTPVIRVSYTGSNAISTSISGFTEANAISCEFTAGTYPLAFLNSEVVRNVNFTGYAGTLTTSGTSTIFGNLTLSTGMSLASGTGTVNMGATSGTKTITTSGKTLDFPVTINGAGGTFQLLDNFTLGSTRTFRLTNGTLNLNGHTLIPGAQLSTDTGTKNITFNGGTIRCEQTGSGITNNSPTGFTTTAGTGTGTITFTNAGTKTFAGGGSTWNCAVNNGGAGALTITGNNTITTLSNSVQPTAFVFTSSTTQTVTNFNVSGTPGNLVTITASTPGTRATLSKASGTVSVSNCSITDSNATGGAVWEAFTANGNTNGGNNLGWLFAAAALGGNFLAFFI